MQLDRYNKELHLTFEFYDKQQYTLNSIFYKKGKIDLDE